MKKYMMDSNDPPQIRGIPVDFAGGTPVVARWQPDVDLPVIPNRFCHPKGGRTEGSVRKQRISFPGKGSRADSKNQRKVHDRPLIRIYKCFKMYRKKNLHNGIMNSPPKSIGGKPCALCDIESLTGSLLTTDMSEELSRLVFNRYQQIRREIFAQTGVDILDAAKHVERN